MGWMRQEHTGHRSSRSSRQGWPTESYQHLCPMCMQAERGGVRGLHGDLKVPGNGGGLSLIGHLW